jgi:integrase/recombinase XerD
VRFGRDGSELTTRSYAGGIALFARWCGRTGRHWHVGVEHLALFITWLRHAGAQVSGVGVAANTAMYASISTSSAAGVYDVTGVSALAHFAGIPSWLPEAGPTATAFP